MRDNNKNVLDYLNVPNIISMIGLGTGWLAIALLIQGFPFLAIVFAIIAFYLDCLDGLVARKMHKESEFGRQLDGLFDFFNYSVFSALLYWLYISPNALGVCIGFLILATGAFRLIRFNIEGFVVIESELYYAGIVVCHISLTAIVLYLCQQVSPQVVSIVAPVIIATMSLLQVSRILVKKTNTYVFWITLAMVLLAISFTLHIWQI